jgi:hypothetical protein
VRACTVVSVRYTDPSGNGACDGKYAGDPDCEKVGGVDDLTDILNDYGWEVKGDWSSEELTMIWDVAKDISHYIHDLTEKNGNEMIQKYLGAVFMKGFVPSLINKIVKAIGTVPWKNGINLSDGFTKWNVAHELGHVFENNLAGGSLPATLIGGGPADAMISAMNGNPQECGIPRWDCKGDKPYYYNNIAGDDPWPVMAYGNHSVADDFADTFAASIYDRTSVPIGRLTWMESFIYVLP